MPEARRSLSVRLGPLFRWRGRVARRRTCCPGRLVNRVMGGLFPQGVWGRWWLSSWSHTAKVIRVHPIHHDRTRELGAFANAKGRPRCRATARGVAHRPSSLGQRRERDPLAPRAGMPTCAKPAGPRLLESLSSHRAGSPRTDASFCSRLSAGLPAVRDFRTRRSGFQDV